MKLYKVNYSEFLDSESKYNPWELNNLILHDQNLIVGKNATGKTRSVAVIYNVAFIIKNPLGYSNNPIKNGTWDLEFIKDRETYKYKFSLKDGNVLEEKITLNDKILLDRNKNKTLITSNNGNRQEINPPNDKLVLHIRRDKIEYPFFEDLFEWANNTQAYSFLNNNPKIIAVPSNLENLPKFDVVPTVLDKLSPDSIKKVIKNINISGFDVEDIKTDILSGLPPNIKLLFLKEKKILIPIPQNQLSSGMFSVCSTLVISQYILDHLSDKNVTIIIDDLCEGLDYERSIRLTNLLFDMFKDKNIQFIAATNDHSLMNIVDIEKWNVLIKKGTKVQAYNYDNKPELFDEFKTKGLNNFDFLSSDYLDKHNV